MADLTPRTRSESFLNGEDLEPITRREHFYAGRENELPEGHQEPETREEWFIQKYREAGDVTVESLSITENGTYTAPSGKAYSPVSVNVPLPSNAYLLQSIENVNIATFADGTDNFVKSLEVTIEPIQSGSGEPSPSNIRPIIGWDEVNVTVADDLENPTASNVYTIDLDGTRYGCKLDVINGVLTVDEVNVFLKDLTFTRQARGSNVGGYYFRAEIDDNAISDTDATQLYSHGVSNNPYTSKENCARAFESSAYLFVGFSDEMNITTLADFNTWVSNNQNASICYKIKTPIEVQLTPTIIKSLQGENNFFASTGEIELLQYWGEVS